MRIINCINYTLTGKLMRLNSELLYPGLKPSHKIFIVILCQWCLSLDDHMSEFLNMVETTNYYKPSQVSGQK